MPQATQEIPPETRARIEQALKVLRDRGATNDYCPRCSTDNWKVELIAIPAVSVPNLVLAWRQGSGLAPTTAYQTGYIPLLSIACANCGYTIFHNLNVLGISWE
jgi:predicted nucleic-acid-binding Zn-ribbon protein